MEQGPPCLPRVVLPVQGTLQLDIYSDLHVGARGFMADKLRHDLARTLDGDNRYAVFNGDLFNSAMRDAKHGGVYEEVLNLDESIDYLEDALTPLVKAGRVLAITGGNHDAYAWNRAGIDPVRQLAARLRLADRYMPVGGWLWTAHGAASNSHHRLGGHRPIEYRGWLSHGTGNSAASGSVEKVASRFEADWYAFGHTHAPLHLTGDRYKVYPQTGSVIRETYTMAVGGSYLAYGGYALEKTLQPRPNGHLSLFLHDGTKDIDVRLPRS